MACYFLYASIRVTGGAIYVYNLAQVKILGSSTFSGLLSMGIDSAQVRQDCGIVG